MKINMFFQPLEQFEIFFLGKIGGLTITNSTIYLMILSFVIFFLFSMVFLQSRLIPYNLQILVEEIYNFVFGLVKQQMNTKGYAYFPLIFSLFLFILIANIIGMCLYSFTLTSHIVIAFALSFSMFMGIVIIGILIQKLAFINTFVPAGAPKALTPFLIGIEIISYFSRPFSLGIRLFANLMSGHTLLAILANFAFLISKKSFIIFLLPFLLITAIVGLEIMIAMLQAYVFTVLVCIYLNDSLVGSH